MTNPLTTEIPTVPSGSTASHSGGVLERLAAALGRVAAPVMRLHRMLRHGALDAHTLRDLGIESWQIEHELRHGRSDRRDAVSVGGRIPFDMYRL